MIGTFINTGAVILGSTIGLIIHSRLPEKIVKIVFQAIGLFTILIGVQMGLQTQNFLILILSLVIGSSLGEWIGIEKWLDSISEKLKMTLKIKNEKFSQGITIAFLQFCVGSLTILGTLQEGMGISKDLILTKSILDGVSSIALASVFGIGILFAAIPLFVFQMSLTFIGMVAGNVLSNELLLSINSTGGILLIGLGIRILEIKEIKVLNMLPSLPFALLITYFITLF